MYENFGVEMHVLHMLWIQKAKGVVLNSWQEIADYLMLVLSCAIRDDEDIWDDLNIYEQFSLFDIEPTIDQLYNKKDAGQCMAGPYAELYFSIKLKDDLDALKFSERGHASMTRKLGRIHYDISGCIAGLYLIAEGNPITSHMVELFVVSLIAHERMHAEQDIDEYASVRQMHLISQRFKKEGYSVEVMQEYINQPHESMAEYASIFAIQEFVALWYGPDYFK